MTTSPTIIMITFFNNDGEKITMTISSMNNYSVDNRKKL